MSPEAGKPDVVGLHTVVTCCFKRYCFCNARCIVADPAVPAVACHADHGLVAADIVSQEKKLAD